MSENKPEAKTEQKTGTKKYLIELAYFRNQTGVFYPPGSIVEIPEDEKPSVTWRQPDGSPLPAWKPVVEAAPAAVAAPVVEPAKDTKAPVKQTGRIPDKSAI